jgi:hypothetical protein
VLGLDIENCAKAGVLVTASGNVQVAGCFIGTDATGETAAPNGTGVELDNSSNLIGGPNVGDRNVLSGCGNAQTPGWTHDGVFVPDKASNPLGVTPSANVIENNIIGLDASGTKAIDNHYAGVQDSGSGDVYGGTAVGLGNVISGNFSAGLITSGNVTIEGNYIGTDVTGNIAIKLPNPGSYGIFSQEAAGATSINMTIVNNVISGDSYGIELVQTVGSQSSYKIANNLIGTNAAGTAALGSSNCGLKLISVENATVQNNVISGNQIGVDLQTNTPSGELQHEIFQGNLIGTDKTGKVAIGNVLQGIEIDSGTGITIGGPGPGQGNVIANSGYYGIYMLAGEQIQLTRNSIYGNAKQGIYENYLTNGMIGPPTLTFTPATGNSGTLSVTLASAKKNASYVIEIFFDPTSQFGAGQTFLQAVPVTTDSSGNASFSLTEPVGYYSATTTDSLGDTSAFSDVVGTAGFPVSVTAVSSSMNPAMVGQSVTFTAVVSAPGFQGTPKGTVIFTIDGQAQSPVPLLVVGGVDEARFVTSTLAAGQYSVTAAYSGDANVSPSSGSLPTQTVNAPSLQPTTTTLVSSLNPSTVGQQVTFTALVSPGMSAGTPTGTVTFTIDGTPQTPVPLQVVNGHEQATFSIATQSPGTYTIAAKYNGDTTFAASAAASPLVQTVTAIQSVDRQPTPAPQVTVESAQPPPPLVTIESVQLLTNKRHRVTEVILGFSGGLESAQAQNTAEYRLVKAGRRGLFTAKHAKLIKLRSAVYGGTSDTVTLTPNKAFAFTKPVQLQVSGEPPSGLEDTLGRLIDGNHDGQPGSNAVAVLQRSGAAISSVVRGPLFVVRRGSVGVTRS